MLRRGIKNTKTGKALAAETSTAKSGDVVATALSQVDVTYFDGVDALGRSNTPRSLTFLLEGNAAVPTWVDVNRALSLNHPKDDSSTTFTPVQQVFTSERQDVVSGSYIPAVDGVYWNSLQPDANGDLTNWQKLTTLNGVTDSWIVENSAGDTTTLYNISNVPNGQNIQIYKNQSISHEVLIPNVQDKYGLIAKLAFFDQDNSNNNLFITDEGLLLSGNRSLIKDGYGNILALPEINNIVKVNNVFYALVNSRDGINTVYSTTNSPITDDWTVTQTYNVCSHLRGYYAGPADFLIKTGEPVKYNNAQISSLWNGLSDLIVFRSTINPFTEISTVYDQFEGVKTFDVNGGFAGLVPKTHGTTTPPLTRMTETYDSSNGSVARWLVRTPENSIGSFDLRGSVVTGSTRFAIGNVYGGESGTSRGVVVNVPATRTPTTQIVIPGNYEEQTVFLENGVVQLSENPLVNGCATELTVISADSTGSGRITRKFTVVPVFFENTSQMSVYLFEPDDYGQYHWNAAPSTVIGFNNDNFNEGTVIGHLAVQDALVLNSTVLYVTVLDHDTDTVSVFSVNLAEFFFPSTTEDDEPLMFVPEPSYWKYSVYNVVRERTSSGYTSRSLVDFQMNDFRTIALFDGSTCRIPFTQTYFPVMPVFPPETLFDYTRMYNASNLSSLANMMLGTNVRNKDDFGELVGTSEGEHGWSVVDSAVYKFNFDGTYEESVESTKKHVNVNSVACSFEPTVRTVEHNSSETPPASTPFSKNSFGFKLLNADLQKTAVYVQGLSKAVKSTPWFSSNSQYFYAAVYDVTGVEWNNEPVLVPGTNPQKWNWTAEPVLENRRYALFRATSDSITELDPVTYDEDLSYDVLGPISWDFLDSQYKYPRYLTFTTGSLVRSVTSIIQPDSWQNHGTINGITGSRQYVSFSDGRVLTWNGKTLYLLDPESKTVVDTVNLAGLAGNNTIVSLQVVYNLLKEGGSRDDKKATIYIFTVDETTRSATTNVTICSALYDSDASDHVQSPGYAYSANNADFLTSGSVYMANRVDELGNTVEFLLYSSTNGGVKTASKKLYSIGSRTENLDNQTFDGSTFRMSNGLLLAGSSDGLYNVCKHTWTEGDTPRTELKSVEVYSGYSGGSNKDAWFNYAANNVSSYTITNNFNPTIVEVTATEATPRDIKTAAGRKPSVFDVVAIGNAGSYSNVDFYSNGGNVYQISTMTVTNRGDNLLDVVYNGRTLLSGITHGFPTKDQLSVGNLLSGTLLDFHVPYFTVDVATQTPSVYIDTLYNTVELEDEFGQIYWTVGLQLDNMVSSVFGSPDNAVTWRHIPQRIRLSEPYDKPLLFTTVDSPGTPSAAVILTTKEGQTVYRAVPRDDWNATHLRKVIREQAHLDNIANGLKTDPNGLYLSADSTVALDAGTMMFNGVSGIAVYDGWEKNIMYFGSCVPPYTLFNSRIQDTFVTTIKKYGDTDMDFVLGTSRGFIHLLNGRLFAKAVYTNEDREEAVLSNNCTFAECYKVSDGTSIRNKFLFTDGHGLYHVNEHEFGAERDVGELFRLTNETIHDVIRLGDGSYVICTNRSVYTAQPGKLIRDYLDDYMLSNLNNVVDAAFGQLLQEHRVERHFSGSNMDVINRKVDKNFNPYPTGFTSTSPVVTSRHVTNVDNDLVDEMEVRLTDAQAAMATSNVFAAVQNSIITNYGTGTRTYAPAGWYDRVVDMNDESHVVDFSDIRYVCRKWHSGLTEFYIYVPTTFTYYMNNVAGYSQSPYTGLDFARPNIKNMQIANDVNNMYTGLRLYINNTVYKLNTLYTVEIVGNSLPLKVYMDSVHCDSNKAGLFDTLVEPSVVRTLPLTTGRSKNNVNQLLTPSNQICLEFAVYGTDAQAVHVLASR